MRGIGLKTVWPVRAFDLQFFAGERTEPATPRRRNKAREDGQMAKSQDLTAATVIISGLLSLYLLSGFFYESIVSMLRATLSHMASETMAGDDWWHVPAYAAMKAFFSAWLPVGLLCAAGAVVILVRQVGFKIITKPFVPKFDRFNPVSGLKKIFSARSLVELAKGFSKAFVLLWVLYAAIRDEKDFFLALMDYNLFQGAVAVMGKIWWLALKMSLFLLLIGLIDHTYQKWSFEKSIRMSKQEIKDEYKQMEGDPTIKRRIRQKQRELARGRMMSDVPKADVVVTNPTHIAVAIQYDQKSMIAPVVIAKGQGLIARRIRDLAEENKIPVIENRPLARALMAQVEIGEAVPQELYRSVAEVLAFIYRLKEKRPAAGGVSTASAPGKYGV
ncbi:MAG: flagellar biosynthesis protein FlhB [Synergistaceae bacterium]|jgi:flagellar biosynthetic protein FlhB|nr:flagellar biosynthesis protein FlhB [Synergistaceae bacterium]